MKIKFHHVSRFIVRGFALFMFVFAFTTMYHGESFFSIVMAAFMFSGFPYFLLRACWKDVPIDKYKTSFGYDPEHPNKYMSHFL